MRTLIITREKNAAACLIPIKIYIEDSTAPELTITGIPCRLLGKLKNGETASFPIPCGAARIFAITDHTSRNYCGDQYPLPAGEEDLSLSGHCHLNPANGNAFLFNSNTDEAALQHRRIGVRRGLTVLLAAIAIGLLLGIFVLGPLIRLSMGTANDPQPQIFSQAGLQITLTEDFTPNHTAEGFDACYLSPEAAVFALRDPFDLAEGFGELTVAEYGALVQETNPNIAGVAIEEEDGMLCMTYEINADGASFFYFNTLHKTDDAFWQVCFVVSADLSDSYRGNMLRWAKSIRFTD
ncbi:MAG: hypothetical protein IJF49_06785 [Clostridia bacterium]|nr:hypothetical protein [Clostridia bacterium]